MTHINSGPALEERFAVALHNTAKIWRQGVDRRLRHLGLSQAAWLAIAAIAKAQRALSQIELANELGIEGPSVVSLVDRLVKMGLVERRPSALDRRVKHIVLTDGGGALYADVRSEASRYRQEILNDVDRAQLMDFTKLLEALQGRIQEIS